MAGKKRPAPGEICIREVSSVLQFTVRGPANTYSSVGFGYTIKADVNGTENDAVMAKEKLDQLTLAFCKDRFHTATEEHRKIVRENEENL